VIQHILVDVSFWAGVLPEAVRTRAAAIIPPWDKRPDYVDLESDSPSVGDSLGGKVGASIGE